MIENEEQYRVTQEKEQTFSQLVKRMESGEAHSIPGENPTIRQAKMDATQSILQELREELQEWEFEAAPRRNRRPANSITATYSGTD